MTEVKVISPFTDLVEGVFRTKGDTFSCEDERANTLSGLKFVEIVAVPEPPKKTRKRITKKG